MTLNQNQERVVAITLRLLEERLAAIERLMTVEEPAILYHRTPRFSPQQQAKMQALVDEARAGVQALAGLFQLPREEQDPARKIAALTSVTWESLEDLRAHRLAAYGAVDPRLQDTLDPWVRKLTQLIVALEKVALDE